jgi:hypothetical protein
MMLALLMAVVLLVDVLILKETVMITMNALLMIVTVLLDVM